MSGNLDNESAQADGRSPLSELRDACIAELRFSSRFSELAIWVAGEVANYVGEAPRGNIHDFAWRQVIAWLRHNVTDYDTLPDSVELVDAELDPDETAKEMDRVQIERRMNANANVREIIALHQTDNEGHNESCPLCAKYTARVSG